MRIALFNWRDLAHPKAGGAEVLTDLLVSGLAGRGHVVTIFSSRVRRAPARERRNGYDIRRAGSEISCRIHAARWLLAERDNFDVVIDEVNTLPFFSPFIAPSKTLLYIQQAAQEVWLAEAPPLAGWIGYNLEPALMAIYRRTPVVALSESTASSCRDMGLRGTIDVLPPAVEAPAALRSSDAIVGRIGYVGRLNPSKRVDHIIQAAALARRSIPHVSLEIVGTGPASEVRRLARVVREHGLEGAVMFRGRLDDAERDAALAHFDVLAMASCREGWGLVVTEAAHFGVPSAVYPVPGLVDSTIDGVTGLFASSSTPDALAAAIVRIVSDRALRSKLGSSARVHAARFTGSAMIDGFERILAARFPVREAVSAAAEIRSGVESGMVEA